MKYFNGFKFSLLVIFSTFILTSCGGGGGGGGPSVSISATSISLSANKNAATPTSPVITLTASKGSVYISPSSTNNGINGHSLYCPFTDTCTLEIQPRSPSSLLVGTYTDTISLIACSDNACNNVINTFSVTVTYVVSEGGSFTTTPSSVSVTTPEGIVAAAQNINVSYSGGASTSWVANINYINGSNWLTLSQTTGSATTATDITASFSSLPVGIYAASIDIISNGGTVTTTIPVTYSVIDPQTNPVQLSYQVDLNTQAADLQTVLTILSNFAGSNPSANWSITSDVNWITFSQSSGDTVSQNQVTVSVVSAEVSNLGNGTHTGTVTLSSTTAGVNDWIVPVTMVVNLPQVNYVSPYVALSSTTGNVIIRGSGFTGITNQAINVGASPASSINVISDTEIRISHPSLTAGAHSVTIPNQLNIAMTRADLQVVNPVSYSSGSVATSGSNKQRAIYDAPRQTLYVADTSFSELERYHWNGTSWVADSLSIANLLDIALTPDGKEIIAVGLFTIHHIDLNSFINIAQHTLSETATSIAMTNDGYAMIGSQSISSGYFKYNVLTRSDTFIPSNGSAALANPAFAGSYDGSKLFLAGGSGAQAQYVYTYESADNGTLQESSLVQSINLVDTDLTGSRVLFDTDQVYDDLLNYQGSLVGMSATTLSKDGNLAYCYNFSPRAIRIYDLTNPNGSGGFNQSGSDLAFATSPGSVKRLALTPSEKNIFIVGSTAVVIVPIP